MQFFINVIKHLKATQPMTFIICAWSSGFNQTPTYFSSCEKWKSKSYSVQNGIEFESKDRGIYDNTVRRSRRGLSELAHIQRSPSPPLLSCLSRERLSAFDSTVKLLIWCWESAGSLSTRCIRFRYSLIKLRWCKAWV